MSFRWRRSATSVAAAPVFIAVVSCGADERAKPEADG